MEVPAYSVMRNPGGSIDVWIDGHRIHFPITGEPFADKQPVSSDAVESDPEVKLRVGEDSIGVGCNGRLVLIKGDGVVVVPDVPIGGSGSIHRRLRMRRMHD